MYEYQCGDCGTVSEYLVGVGSDEPVVACTECGSQTMRRMISIVSFARGSHSEGCACERGGSCEDGACSGPHGQCACHA